MPLPAFARAIPNEALQASDLQDQADSWAKDQMSKLADDWAKQAMAQPPSAPPARDDWSQAQPAAPTPSDSLTNPLQSQAAAVPTAPPPVAAEQPASFPTAPAAASALAPDSSLPTSFSGTPVDRQSQFGLGLSSADAMAFCGPTAAIAFAKTYGRNPSVDEAKQLAQSVGWNPNMGMAGVGSEQALLTKMGVQTKLEQGINWDHVATDANNGNPVIIDTPGHYFYVTGARDGSNGKEFNVGTSGTDLRQGAQWMTSSQMAQVMGAPRAALYADHPLAPGPSQAEQQPLAQLSDTLGGAFSAVKDKAGQIVDAIQNIGKTDQPGPPIQGDYTSLLPGGTQDPVEAGGQAARDAGLALSSQGLLAKAMDPNVSDDELANQAIMALSAGKSGEGPGAPRPLSGRGGVPGANVGRVPNEVPPTTDLAQALEDNLRMMGKSESEIAAIKAGTQPAPGPSELAKKLAPGIGISPEELQRRWDASDAAVNAFGGGAEWDRRLQALRDSPEFKAASPGQQQWMLDTETGIMERQSTAGSPSLGDKATLLDYMRDPKNWRAQESSAMPPEGTVQRFLLNSDITNAQVPFKGGDWQTQLNNVRQTKAYQDASPAQQAQMVADAQAGFKGDANAPQRIVSEQVVPPNPTSTYGPGGGVLAEGATGAGQAARLEPGWEQIPGKQGGAVEKPSKIISANQDVGQPSSLSNATEPFGQVPVKRAGITDDTIQAAHARIDKALGSDPNRADMAHNELDQMLSAGAAPDEVARFLTGEVEGNWPGLTSIIRTVRTGSMAGGLTTEGKVLLSPIVQTAMRAPVGALKMIVRGQAGDIPTALQGGLAGLAEGAQDALQTIKYGTSYRAALTGGAQGGYGFAPGIDVMGNAAQRVAGTAALGLVRTHGAVADISAGIGRGAASALGATPEAAGEIGQQWALRSGDYGATGKLVASVFDDLRAKGKVADLAGQILIPFYRVGYNAITQGVERSPLGLAGRVTDALQGKALDTDKLANNMFGVGLAVFGFAQAGQGNITGENPEGGAPRWSVRVGGQWIPLRTLGPAGEAFAQSAILYESARDGQGNIPQIAVKSALAYKDHIADETWLRSVAEAFDAMTDKTGRATTKFLTNLGKSFVPEERLGEQVGARAGAGAVPSQPSGGFGGANSGFGAGGGFGGSQQGFGGR